LPKINNSAAESPALPLDNGELASQFDLPHWFVINEVEYESEV
jgi:hypothetical protein